MSAEKQRVPHAVGMAVAGEVLSWMERSCEPARIMVCGSLRRQKPSVGDVEIVYVPRFRAATFGVGDLFAPGPPLNEVNEQIDFYLSRGELVMRRNILGRSSWGDKNKLAIHGGSGVAVDLFETTEKSFWNYVVCRTGGPKTNIRIAGRARGMGWMWHPYGEGFERRGGPDRGKWRVVTCEEEVFDHVRMPYLRPEERE